MQSTTILDSTIQIHFLTDDQTLQDICTCYWSINPSTHKFSFTIREILDTFPQFSLRSGTLAEFIAQYCRAFSIALCPICHEPRIYRNRTDYSEHYVVEKIVNCPTCYQKEIKRQQQQRQSYQREQRETLQRYYSWAVHHQWKAEDLSFREAMYVVAMARLLGTDDPTHIIPYYLRPLSQVQQPLTPDQTWTVAICDHLLGKRYLCVSASFTDASILSYSRNEANTLVITGFPALRVCWQFTSDPEPYAEAKKYERGQSGIEKIERWIRSAEYPAHWTETAWRELAYEVAYAECIEFLLYQMTLHKFTFSPGEKTKMVFDQALEYFSVAQIYRIIGESVMGAAAYYQRGTVSKTQATNSVITRIQAKIEKARDEKRDVVPFRRSWDCPRSMLSEVVFSGFLHSGDAGFTELPTAWRRDEIDSVDD